MNRLLWSSLAIAAMTLVAAPPAVAASLTINDAAVDGLITFTVGQFDTGSGFVLDGTQILPPSLGTAPPRFRKAAPPAVRSLTLLRDSS